MPDDWAWRAETADTRNGGGDGSPPSGIRAPWGWRQEGRGGNGKAAIGCAAQSMGNGGAVLRPR